MRDYDPKDESDQEDAKKHLARNNLRECQDDRMAFALALEKIAPEEAKRIWSLSRSTGGPGTWTSRL